MGSRVRFPTFPIIAAEFHARPPRRIPLNKFWPSQFPGAIRFPPVRENTAWHAGRQKGGPASPCPEKKGENPSPSIPHKLHGRERGMLEKWATAVRVDWWPFPSFACLVAYSVACFRRRVGRNSHIPPNSKAKNTPLTLLREKLAKLHGFLMKITFFLFKRTRRMCVTFSPLFFRRQAFFRAEEK